MPASRVKAAFIEPMLLLRKEKLPEGDEWLYEIKLDGYRAIAFKSNREVQLRCRHSAHKITPVIRPGKGCFDKSLVDGRHRSRGRPMRPERFEHQNRAVLPFCCNFPESGTVRPIARQKAPSDFAWRF
jgi:hypothetical protein